MKESGENYLETILILSHENESVRAVDIASRLGFSRPSVSRALSILRAEGLICVGTGGEISLTAVGKAAAEAIYERHTIIKRYLVSVLELPDDIAEADACRIEHVISEQAFLKIKSAALKADGK